MQLQPSDTTLLQRLKADADASAAQQIWQRYFERLAGLARKKLRHSARRASDEEDIALSALNSFFRGAAAGRFPKLSDRHDLWQVLVLIAERKVIDGQRRELAAKRGAGQVRGDSAIVAGDSSSSRALDQHSGMEPSPEFVAAFAEQCERLYELLDDPELRVVALLKSEGYTNEEIAKSLDRVPRSIERKLRTIRSLWQKELSD